MVKAKDIMIKEVLKVTPQTLIGTAIKILTIRNVSGLPVVDENNLLKGVITEKDLLGILKDPDNMRDKTVADFMTRKVTSFSPEDEVEMICEFLINNPFRRVPIIEDEKLMGLISRADIIAFIYKTRFQP